MVNDSQKLISMQHISKGETNINLYGALQKSKI